LEHAGFLFSLLESTRALCSDGTQKGKSRGEGIGKAAVSTSGKEGGTAGGSEDYTT